LANATHARVITLGLLLSALAAPPAVAQDDQHGYLSVFGGATVGNRTSGSVGVRLGASLAGNLDVLGTFAYDRNVVNADLESALLGYVPDGTIKDGAATWAGGMRMLTSANRNSVRPYVQALLGIHKFYGAVMKANGTDIMYSLSTAEDPNVGDLLGSKFMVSVGGGVEIPAARLPGGQRFVLDLGYEWARPLNTVTVFNIHRLHAGMGLRF
jgi:hypothetical protein